MRSPFLMDGYFDDPEATAAALRDGWFHTGDLGALDADGYLSIVGRLQDVIRTGGESVSPAEVEAALAGAPGVRGAGGGRHPRRAVGRSRVRGGRRERGRGAHARCAARALRGAPRRLQAAAPARAADALPRTAATGQVQRTLLVERIIARGLKERAMSAERRLGDVATKLLFENERVRIWEMRLGPGERATSTATTSTTCSCRSRATAWRWSPSPTAAAAIGTTSRPRSFPGNAIFIERGGIEKAKNVGKRAYREILIELKD